MTSKTKKPAPKGTAIIGSNVASVQAALALARMGVQVKLLTDSAALSWDNTFNSIPSSPLDRRYLWPLLLRAASHPMITLHSNITVEHIEGKKGDFKIRAQRHPRYIKEELCTACSRCEAECSVKLTSLSGDRKTAHGAIHSPLYGAKSVPSAYIIDKNGASPCHANCPLGINVQGFVSLLSKGKTDKALALINESAPLAGILGRVCTHPCEDKCNRAEFDCAVSIRALHRYTADNNLGSIKYGRKLPARSRSGKIAIVGSGPAGLTAAWELTRRGYSPTVFESHGVIGGMLATGIPRFRLPKEVREREIEAINKMGIDIRTGITVGRDITYTYLKERGYQAFFLAIGAQQNNRLNIPGEEVDDVVDCLSLLLALNLKFDTFVGSNVAVIGGGNAAIDAARSTLRSGAKEVTIFYRRTRAEMPANAEEVDEAIKEGIKIEFNTVPVEVMVEEGKVTGLHCQRIRMTEETTSDGKRLLETIPDSDFLTVADHVVVAIGQQPDAPQLKIAGLKVDRDTGVIKANPLTLETSLPGIFAGGDCITGPNNVVEAVAAGLRAAESIDRYLQGEDLEAGHSFEQPPTAGIDLETMEVSPYKRARMPVVRAKKRLHTYEETTLGLTDRAAQRETQRCLNCALCSQCTECTIACELGAVCHEDIVRDFEISAEAILKFPAGNALQEIDQPGILTIFSDGSADLTNELVKAMAAALETTFELKQDKEQTPGTRKPDILPAQLPQSPVLPAGDKNLGVFLCSCGSSISSVIDFNTVSRKLSAFSRVNFINEIAQACTESGARQIAEKVAERQLDQIVLAACRCCNLEQVCYSCTDRRQMCQQYLYQYLAKHHGISIEFCNIREQCAWAHKDTPRDATQKAIQIIAAGIARAQIMPPITTDEKPVLPNILVLGGGLVNTTAARALASRGYQVKLISQHELKIKLPEAELSIPPALGIYPAGNLEIKPIPDSWQFYGSPGNYEVILKYGSQSEHFNTGAALLDMNELEREEPGILEKYHGNGLLGRIISRRKNQECTSGISRDLIHEITIGETTGILILSTDYAESTDEQVLLGQATAARIAAYMGTNISPRASAVSIDSQRCRGCGDCADICPYIEMRQQQGGIALACIDKSLCLGCGACIAVCPSGAITQPYQSDRQLIETISSMLSIPVPGGV